MKTLLKPYNKEYDINLLLKLNKIQVKRSLKETLVIKEMFTEGISKELQEIINENWEVDDWSTKRFYEQTNN